MSPVGHVSVAVCKVCPQGGAAVGLALGVTHSELKGRGTAYP